MRVQQLLAGLVFIQQTFHDEDAEIVSHTENECGEDNVHDIELNPEHPHYSGDYQPADRHRQEAEQCQFQPSV